MTTDNDLIQMTTEIVSSYLGNNQIEPAEVGVLISTIHGALTAASTGVVEEVVEEFERASSAQIRKSITDDFLISFIDGRKFKTLKRHLSIQGMTPDQYRERYGLPATYPMVAPGYSASRSRLAMEIGLGQRGRVAKAVVKAPAKAVKAAPKASKPAKAKAAPKAPTPPREPLHGEKTEASE